MRWRSATDRAPPEPPPQRPVSVSTIICLSRSLRRCHSPPLHATAVFSFLRATGRGSALCSSVLVPVLVRVPLWRRSLRPSQVTDRLDHPPPALRRSFRMRLLRGELRVDCVCVSVCQRDASSPATCAGSDAPAAQRRRLQRPPTSRLEICVAPACLLPLALPPPCSLSPPCMFRSPLLDPPPRECPPSRSDRGCVVDQECVAAWRAHSGVVRSVVCAACAQLGVPAVLGTSDVPTAGRRSLDQSFPRPDYSSKVCVCFDRIVRPCKAPASTHALAWVRATSGVARWPHTSLLADQGHPTDDRRFPLGWPSRLWPARGDVDSACQK